MNGNPSSANVRITRYPGSLIPGYPPSEHSATGVPARTSPAMRRETPSSFPWR